jgi:PTS system mannose-specific IIA component
VRGFRIVVASHGDLAAAFLASAEMIVGPIDDAYGVALRPEHSPEDYAALLRAVVGDGPCLILADLAGGTPSNVAMMVARGRPDVVAVAGISLGMVVEAATSLASLDEEAIGGFVTAGRDGVVNAGARLARAGT